MQKWIVTPVNPPAVLRNCPKCGCERSYRCSGNFRINANGRNIDVWLIYKCEKCDSTWNMPVLSRVRPEEIDKTLYMSFIENNHDTALRYAFDKSVLNNSRAMVDYSSVEYRIEKLAGKGDCLEICCETDFNIRLDRFISNECGISRTAAKKLLEQNGISPKAKLHKNLILMNVDTNDNQTE